MKEVERGVIAFLLPGGQFCGREGEGCCKESKWLQLVPHMAAGLHSD